MVKEKNNFPRVKPGVQDNYDVAFRETFSMLKSMDAMEAARKSGSEISSDSRGVVISVPFLGRRIIVDVSGSTVTFAGSGDEVPQWLQIVTLHYLVFAKGTISDGSQITFKQIEGGLSYYPVFQKRTIRPIIRAFGPDFREFIRHGLSIGGTEEHFGDYSLKIGAFPRVNLTYVIWKGDDEFPVEGNVMFDSVISDYLSTEDIAILCSMTAFMIIRSYHEEKAKK